ncbi:glycosyltransferase family 2 protein [Paenibacillus ginsengarvi]|uniref:Glycosyltransferase n=1 Tax=Paenibacillus ginsengarvi TaxID=400777 RepID=A0A3B0BV81_9BACL|nr:glycosyltransferase [Paenibacillus ginsengarvi]RKN75907.1 glycosyltransferase [Paenibacillus ginsengarvi]
MKISVVMAVYNGELYVQQAIDSVLAQTYDNFELIVIDDGSTDRTPKILDRLKDKRIIKYRLPTNRGAANALNFAIKKARGDWIAVHDADDVSMPERLAVQAGYVLQNPELVAVGSKITCIGENDVDPNQLRRTETNLNYGNDSELLYRNRYLVCPICHGTALFSKAKFLEAGGYDTSFRITYDYDLWLRLFQHGPIGKIDEVLYKYRIHSSSLSRRNGMATYMEKLRCCIMRLRQFEYSHLASDPRLIVFADRMISRNAVRHVLPHCPVQIYSHFDNSSNGSYPEKAVKLYKRGRIDGVMLFQIKQRKELSTFFQNKGMILNKNLFLL